MQVFIFRGVPKNKNLHLTILKLTIHSIALSFVNAKGNDVATKDDIRVVKDEIIHQMNKRFEMM